MDDFDDRPIREQLAELYAKDDALGADTARLLRQPEQRQQKAEQEQPLIRKTYQPRAEANAANTSADWEGWVLDQIKRRIDQNNAVIADVLSEEYVPRHIAKTALDAIRSDISELRAKLTVLEGLLKGSVINLPKPDKTNVA